MSSKLTDFFNSYKEKELMFFRIQELGKYHESIGEIDKSIGYYEEVIQGGYVSTTSYDRLIVFYNKNKQFEESIRVCDTYIKNYINYYQQITRKSEKTLMKDSNIKEFLKRKESILKRVKI